MTQSKNETLEKQRPGRTGRKGKANLGSSESTLDHPPHQGRATFAQLWTNAVYNADDAAFSGIAKRTVKAAKGSDERRHARVSPAQIKHTLAVLARFGDADGRECRPSIDNLACMTSSDPKTVTAALDIAECAGWIARESGGGAGLQNALRVYRLLLPEDADTTTARLRYTAGLVRARGERVRTKPLQPKAAVLSTAPSDKGCRTGVSRLRYPEPKAAVLSTAKLEEQLVEALQEPSSVFDRGSPLTVFGQLSGDDQSDTEWIIEHWEQETGVTLDRESVAMTVEQSDPEAAFYAARDVLETLSVSPIGWHILAQLRTEASL